MIASFKGIMLKVALRCIMHGLVEEEEWTDFVGLLQELNKERPWKQLIEAKECLDVWDFVMLAITAI